MSKLIADGCKKLHEIDLALGQKFCDDALQNIDELVADLDLYVAQNEQVGQYNILETKNLIDNSRNKVSKLAENHKSLHSHVSRYGKLLEKIFVHDFSSIPNPQMFNCEHDFKILNKIIFEHLCSESLIEVATTFAKEAGLEVKEDIGKIYLKMKTLNSDILNFNCDLTLIWLKEECDCQSADRFHLESLLLGLKFCKIIREFPTDLSSKFKILRRLSTVKNIDPNDLKQLAGLMIVDPEEIHKRMSEGTTFNLIKNPVFVSSLFRKVYLNYYGQKTTKPLETTFIAGLLSLPCFSEQTKTALSTTVSPWSQPDIFSLDINLPDEFSFHPRFICPVLKIQANGINKPHVLACGHVLSHDAIKNLSTGTSGYDFKCPYCPKYTKKNESRELLFE